MRRGMWREAWRKVRVQTSVVLLSILSYAEIPAACLECADSVGQPVGQAQGGTEEHSLVGAHAAAAAVTGP